MFILGISKKIYMTTNYFKTIRLETARLYLIPLTYDQLLMYASCDGRLEAELGLLPRNRTIPDDFRLTVESYLMPYIDQHPKQILFATIWVMVEKDQNILIGDVGFNAGPSEKGVVEIGYSTYPDFMNNGYMTEAIKSLSEWAFKQPGVEIIIAQTHKDNFATHRVLSKINFSAFAEADQFYWWRLDKQQD